MNCRTLFLIGLAALVAACAAPATRPDRATLIQQVTATETAFAQTMADRDYEAFLSFISEEAVFLGGGKPLVGKAAIGAAWKPFYTKDKAPFSWKPDLVVALDSGTLGQSNGPVSTPDGKVFARFYSTWRLESDGKWRIVFDNGYDVCPDKAD